GLERRGREEDLLDRRVPRLQIDGRDVGDHARVGPAGEITSADTTLDDQELFLSDKRGSLAEGRPTDVESADHLVLRPHELSFVIGKALGTQSVGNPSDNGVIFGAGHRSILLEMSAGSHGIGINLRLRRWIDTVHESSINSFSRVAFPPGPLYSY